MTARILDIQQGSDRTALLERLRQTIITQTRVRPMQAEDLLMTLGFMCGLAIGKAPHRRPVQYWRSMLLDHMDKGIDAGREDGGENNPMPSGDDIGLN